VRDHRTSHDAFLDARLQPSARRLRLLAGHHGLVVAEVEQQHRLRLARGLLGNWAISVCGSAAARRMTSTATCCGRRSSTICSITARCRAGSAICSDTRSAVW
jgi:hypothetical protein